jgi:hypothetical protein
MADLLQNLIDIPTNVFTEAAKVWHPEQLIKHPRAKSLWNHSCIALAYSRIDGVDEEFDGEAHLLGRDVVENPADESL